MIDRQTVFEIHRLHHLGFEERKIDRTLGISRPTVKRYLENPEPVKPKILRSSKLDPYQDRIQNLLEKDPEVKAPVVLQRLKQDGFNGKITILRDYLRTLLGQQRQPTPFIRFESRPGQQMQIDWGHFGILAYEETMRKLYAAPPQPPSTLSLRSLSGTTTHRYVQLP
jgi:transposase